MLPTFLHSFECEFLSAFCAPKLLQRLMIYQRYHNLPITPIWLNHHTTDEASQQSHSVIGLLPMVSFLYERCDTLCAKAVLSKQISRQMQVFTKCVIHSHANIQTLKQWQSAKTVTFTQASDYHHYLLDNKINISQLSNRSINQQIIKFELSHDDAGYRQFADYLMAYCCHQDYVSINNTSNKINKPPNTGYHHGLMGFISYDASVIYLTNDFTEQSKQINQPQPLAYFGHYPLFLSVMTLKDGNNHPYYKWKLHAQNAWAVSLIDDVVQLLKDMLTLSTSILTTLSSHKQNMSKQSKQASPPPLILTPLWTKTDYQHAFDKIQAHLHAGDCYQINLTQCWQAKLPIKANGDLCQLVEYLPKLHGSTHAPFAGYLMLANTPSFNHDCKYFELLSCSPELFVQFQFTLDGLSPLKITTKPIKGTRPRGKTLAEDQALYNELLNSQKDLAENVMIVDLLRNDLGKYAQTGSVTVPKRFAIESFSNVHHMVSTITATLKQDVHPIWVLFDSLPAGSITGTPKKRSVEIIHQLELMPRGAYCGTLGYLNFDGTGVFNVLIRTLQAKNDGTIQLWAGGGITVASDCELEWQECHDKVGNLLNILSN